MGLILKGVHHTQRGLMKRWGEYNVALKESLMEEGELVVKLANRLAPELTGALRSTGEARTRETRYFINMDVSYGGATEIMTIDGKYDVDYAYVVHEEHPRKSKFLEKAIKELAPNITSNLRIRIQAKLK